MTTQKLRRPPGCLTRGGALAYVSGRNDYNKPVIGCVNFSSRVSVQQFAHAPHQCAVVEGLLDEVRALRQDVAAGEMEGVVTVFACVAEGCARQSPRSHH